MRHIMVLVLTLFAVTAFADVTLTEKSEDTVSVSYFSKGRIAVYEGSQVLNITDLKAQLIYGFNPENKTFFRATFKEMNDFYKKMSSDSEGQDNTPFAGDNAGKSVFVKKTGKGEYAGYSCDRYDVGFPPNQVTSQICVSPQVRQLLLGEMDAASLKRWMNLMDVEDASDPIRNKLDDISDKVGYIVYEKIIDSVPGYGGTEGEGYITVLDSVSTKPVDQSKFSIPKGYKLVPVMQVLGGDEQ